MDDFQKIIGGWPTAFSRGSASAHGPPSPRPNNVDHGPVDDLDVVVGLWLCPEAVIEVKVYWLVGESKVAILKSKG